MHLPKDILLKYWGYSSFRPLQEDIIQSSLDGHDTLALLPTGGGKSICFQVPAMCNEGICIVISPLIALMKDQVYHLQQKGIKAAAIYSGMTYTEIDRTLDNCRFGGYKFLYVSPERLKTEIFIERVKQMNVNLWAVDEAHCISQWGYDFRPPYLEIAEIRAHHPKVPVLALTATATPNVVIDIQEKLAFKKEHVFQKSFLRSNLSYSVLYEDAKYTKLVDILQKVKGSAVVYVRNRRKTKEIAEYLLQCKISATYYHAGLKTDERSLKQEQWIRSEIRVMVSTNAFGMGIDKPDVRTVVHMDLPDSPEAYFQEAGRAGRDEKKAYAVLLFNNADKHNALEKLQETMPSIEEIRLVYRALGNYFQIAEGAGLGKQRPFSIAVFCKRYEFNVVKTYNALKFLEQEGYLFLSDGFNQSSRIMITTSKHQLTKFMHKNLDFEPLILFILRAYSGIFDGFVSIKEHEMAKKLNTTIKEVKKGLELLQKAGMLTYEAFNDEPFLEFLIPRMDEKNMYLNAKIIKERIAVFKSKLNAMIDYASTKTKCRSTVLLAYFGENLEENCGICDYCVGRNKLDINKEEQQQLLKQIQDEVGEESYSLMYLRDKISYQNKDKLMRLIQWLIDYEFLLKTNNNTYTWNKNASY